MFQIRKIYLFPLLICLFLCANTVKLRANPIDSLKQVISNSLDDTNKVLSYLQLSRLYLADEPDIALELAGKAKILSHSLKYYRGEGLSYRRIGSIHYSHNNFEQALDNYNKSIVFLKKINAKEELSEVYNIIGIIHYYLANYEKSLKSYLNSLHIHEELGNKMGMSSAYNNIGIIYNNQDNQQKALEYHFKSLGIDKEIGNKNGIATSYNNIGEIYRIQGKWDKALEYYMKSLKIKEEEKNIDGMS